MSKSLIIAEKQSVAADYAKILNCTQKTGYYEGAKYVIAYAKGHLFQMKEPHDYNDKYKYWDIEDLPIVPEKFQTKIIEDKDKKARYFTIKKLVEREDINIIINGGDSGAEGELIQRWIILNTRTKKPVKRLWINDLTETGILKGLENLKDSSCFDSYYYAANTRTKIDWCLGLNYSRAFTTKIGGQGITLSVGRCQTPILNLIVKRDLEIEKFQTQLYYEVGVSLENYNAKYINGDDGTKIYNESKAQNIMEKVKNKKGVIKEINKEITKERPPQLFNLTDLQMLMSEKHNFNEDKTLNIIQKLYEKDKILSYPRTSSNHLSTNIAAEFEDMLDILNFDVFSNIISNINVHSISKAKEDKRFVDNEKISDHYALIPTQNNIEEIYNSLTNDEKLLFKEVVVRFLSIFFNDYKYETTTIITEVEGYDFITKGKIELEKGWKSICRDTEDNKEEVIKTNLNKGDIELVIDAQVTNNKTKPLPHYNVSTFLSMMKKHNIGTEATRTGLIQTLLKREYVNRDGKKLISTSLGKELISSINIDEIKSLELTSKLEEKLNKILNNEIPYQEVFREAINILENNIEMIKKSDIKTIEKKSEILGPCPVCGGNIVKKKGFYGCSNYKKNNCSYTIPEQLLDTYISTTQIKKLLLKGHTDLLTFTNKDTKDKFKAKLAFNKKLNKNEFISEKKKISRRKKC